MPPRMWYANLPASSQSSSGRQYPFVSHALKDYLDRYWAVMFTVGSRTIESGHLRHYVSWYCTRMKVVLLDHHIHAESLRRQLVEVSRTPDLPLLFVNKQLVGTLHDVQELEQEKKLKDLLHFGFEWRVGGGGNGEKSLTGTLPAPYGDTELFRGRYRGTPVARPVVALPKLHPFDFHSNEQGFAMESVQGIGMHFTGTSPGQAYDLEVVLTELLAKAEKAEAAGVRVREHPSVAFYRGDRPARVQMPPQDGGDVRQTDSCMYVIALHQALLPPCEGVVPTEEQQSARMSSSDGLELLRVNWEWLLWLLMPSVRLGSPTNGKEECNNNNNNNDEEQSASAPICSTRELCRKLEWGDYTQLRQPGLMDRVHYSYVVFLRFYGWRLHDEERGVLDRHQNWKERYKLLSRACDISGGSRSSSKTDEHEGNGDGHASSIGFYDALTRILYVLLELCFTRYAVNLVAFLLEEMNKGRLLFLQPTLEKVWFSQVDCCKQVADAEKKRLRRQLYCLTHSDSD